MKRQVALAGLVFLLVLASAPAALGVDCVFLSRPPVNGEVCSISDAGYSFVNPKNGLTYYGQETAAQFVAPSGLLLSDVHWWGAYGAAPDPAPDDFILRLYANASGKPALTPLAEFVPTSMTRTLTALTAVTFGDHDGGSVYAYSTLLPEPYALTSGTTYYLSIYNDTASRWGWLFDGAGNNWYRSEEPIPFWQQSSIAKSPAFELTTVPEPTTLGYVVLGGVMLALRRRRFRRGVA